MHRDKKTGLALAVLLCGIVGALFFRNEPHSQDNLPALQDPAAIDSEIAARADAAAAAQSGAPLLEADASVTNEPCIACTVQVADCLPVLFAAPGGRAVGAAHAGWRGLAGGVLEATLDAVCALAACGPAEVAAWLGPCIGPRAFEVGAEGLRGFGLDEPAAQVASPFFKPRPGAGGPESKWLADLAGLARSRLTAAGVVHLSGGEWCTVEDPSRFFSFRRDRTTGRLAAAVWIR